MSEGMEEPAQETVSKTTRMAVTAASMAVRHLGTLRQERAQQIAAADAEEAARLQSRWASERAAARAQVAAADDAWLDRSSPAEVAGAWQSAAVWSQFEPDVFAESEARLAAEIQRRYGIDARAVGVQGVADAGELHALADAERLREREHEEAAADAQARATPIDRDDEIGATIVMGGADEDMAADRAIQVGHVQVGEAGFHGDAANALDVDGEAIAYDSDARRSALADRAAAGGAAPDAVHARVVAANASGKPGRRATTAVSRSAAKSRSPHVAPARDIGIER